MECENFFCIYQSKKKCILDEISLNIFGACDCCIYPELDSDYLEKKKQILLEKYDSE